MMTQVTYSMTYITKGTKHRERESERERDARSRKINKCAVLLFFFLAIFN